MISRWPLRSGVLVNSGTCYVTAGMWPSEGVYVYALDADTGEVIWCNDTSDNMYIMQPHDAYALTGVAPQGYVLASKDVLLVPTGRALPAAYDRSTGRLLYYRHTTHLGGVWTAIDEENALFFNGQEPQGVLAYSLANGDIVPDAEHTFVADNCVLARETLLEGKENLVTAASDGKEMWRYGVRGRARGIAVADGRLVVATTEGLIYCFQPREESAPEGRKVTGPSVKTRPNMEGVDATETLAGLLELIEQSRITKGYALVIGRPDAGFTEALACKTGLHVVSVLGDKSKVQEERARLLGTTELYGSRLVVQYLQSAASLPYAPYFANVVVVSGESDDLRGKDLYRVLRPCGGLMYFDQVPRSGIEKLLKDGEVPAAEVRSSGESLHVVRGKLPGAFDWDSEVTCDQRVKWPLELLWFGGPGPGRIATRTECGTPRAANGRYFVLGSNNRVIAMDAYNGTELWSLETDLSIDHPLAAAGPAEGDEHVWLGLSKGNARLPDSLAADDEHVYLNVGSVCYQHDAQTGRLLKAMPLQEAPEWARQWGRMPERSSKDRGNFGQNTHPLTGEKRGHFYVRTAGCGGILSSAAADFFRSATLGIYDYVDDSGLRHFGGVRPSCGGRAGPVSLMLAFGLLISSEGSLGCSCSYNFECSLALVPTRTRKNEDWGVFSDHTDVLGSPLRHAALNLGAPGDRRDDEGVLWLGMPRPGFGMEVGSTGRGGGHERTSLGVPFHVLRGGAFGPYRFDADRVAITGTERPWIYASGYRGLRRAALNLAIYDQEMSALSLGCERPPQIDGHLHDPCWDESPQVSFREGKACIRLRHDDDSLYIAYERAADVDHRGGTRLWKAETKGEDAPVWKDDSFELYMTDKQSPHVLHLGVSASGARYDGLWSYAFDIPRLDKVALDGKPDDWGDGGFRVNIFDNGECRLGWNDHGLLLLAKSTSETFARERRSAGMALVAVKPGVEPFLQLNVSAKERTYAVHHGLGESMTGPALEVVENNTEKAYVVEACFPWEHLDITPAAGAEVGLPIIFYQGDQLEAGWGKYVARDLKDMCRLRLSGEPSRPAGVDYGEWLRVYSIAKANAVVEEDTDWNGDWSVATRTTEDALTAEMAIPWDTLAAIGLRKELLQVKFDKSGKVKTPPPAPRWNTARREYFPPLILRLPNRLAKTYTMRLHFAEIDDVRAGERIFDVRLQGETVLRDFDIVKATGGKFRALVKEFKGILAKNSVTLELIPKSRKVNSTTTPVISGVEVMLEENAAKAE